MTLNSTTVDRTAELEALRDELFALHGGPQFSRRDAAEYAIVQLAELEAFAAEWDATSAAQRPEPTPPATLTSAQRKAAYHIASGLQIRPFNGGWLVPSGTRAGFIHFVNHTGCSCEAGAHGAACWHVAAVELAQTMQQAA